MISSGAQSSLRFATVILAAGASSRMGRPKLLLPWRGTSILVHLVRQWRSLGADAIAVITAVGELETGLELSRCGLDDVIRLVNPAPDRGMFSSIQTAAAWTGWHTALTHWVISLGDQPHVKSETLQSLLQYAAGDPRSVWQPARRGRARHPVIIPRSCFAELAAAPEPNLKLFLAARPSTRKLVELDDAGLDLDLDYPADYEQALKLQSNPASGS